ncbi:DMT family transporter [Candidatus Micrarchaeota archaeon]|nr:DMT family transporter [Candidatus Micrarchaeota archaeon]
MDKKTLGVLCVLFASVAWAFEPILAKLAYLSSDALSTTFFRSLMIFFSGLLYLMLTNNGNIKITQSDLSVLVYLAFAGTLFADFIYLCALSQTSVINAILIGHLQPIFIVLFGYHLLKDHLTQYDYLGLLVMIVAGLLVTAKTVDNLLSFQFGTLGDLFALLATIGWATTTIAMSKFLKHLNSGVIAFYRFGIAASLIFIYLFITAALTIPNIYQILLGLIMGIGIILYYEGLKRIKSAQVGALELSSPVFAAFLAFFILGETTTLLQFFGFILLIFGVLTLSRKET